MNTPNKKELITGIAMLGASLAYLLLAQQLPGHDGIDAATVPKLLAGFLILLGLMQLASAFAKPRAATEAASDLPTEAEEPATEVVEPKTVIKTLGLILGYMALLGPVGFPIMTDRKSTRLNSSHVKISYAVFCLKKKKNIDRTKQ